mmetsp:Transcript_38697/g.109413  ORF Transcript_38697/g.109413 Transcript_38697/m.109413 type:complete len:269 (+) Transcript_38697:226-1032(+)
MNARPSGTSSRWPGNAAILRSEPWMWFTTRRISQRPRTRSCCCATTPLLGRPSRAPAAAPWAAARPPRARTAGARGYGSRSCPSRSGARRSSREGGGPRSASSTPRGRPSAPASRTMLPRCHPRRRPRPRPRPCRRRRRRGCSRGRPQRWPPRPRRWPVPALAAARGASPAPRREAGLRPPAAPPRPGCFRRTRRPPRSRRRTGRSRARRGARRRPSACPRPPWRRRRRRARWSRRRRSRPTGHLWRRTPRTHRSMPSAKTSACRCAT